MSRSEVYRHPTLSQYWAKPLQRHCNALRDDDDGDDCDDDDDDIEDNDNDCAFLS